MNTEADSCIDFKRYIHNLIFSCSLLPINVISPPEVTLTCYFLLVLVKNIFCSGENSAIRLSLVVGIRSVCYYEKSAPEGVLNGVRKECERKKTICELHACNIRMVGLQYANGRVTIRILFSVVFYVKICVD